MSPCLYRGKDMNCGTAISESIDVVIAPQLYKTSGGGGEKKNLRFKEGGKECRKKQIEINGKKFSGRLPAS